MALQQIMHSPFPIDGGPQQACDIKPEVACTRLA